MKIEYIPSNVAVRLANRKLFYRIAIYVDAIQLSMFQMWLEWYAIRNNLPWCVLMLISEYHPIAQKISVQYYLKFRSHQLVSLMATMHLYSPTSSSMDTIVAILWLRPGDTEDWHYDVLHEIMKSIIKITDFYLNKFLKEKNNSHTLASLISRSITSLNSSSARLRSAPNTTALSTINLW